MADIPVAGISYRAVWMDNFINTVTVSIDHSNDYIARTGRSRALFDNITSRYAVLGADFGGYVVLNAIGAAPVGIGPPVSGSLGNNWWGFPPATCSTLAPVAVVVMVTRR